MRFLGSSRSNPIDLTLLPNEVVSTLKERIYDLPEAVRRHAMQFATTEYQRNCLAWLRKMAELFWIQEAAMKFYDDTQILKHRPVETKLRYVECEVELLKQKISIRPPGEPEVHYAQDAFDPCNAPGVLRHWDYMKPYGHVWRHNLKCFLRGASRKRDAESIDYTECPLRAQKRPFKSN